MNDRRKRFRDYLQAFQPTADPAAALDDGRYVPPPDGAAERLAAAFELRPDGCALVVGSIGSGKSTALLQAARLIQASGEADAEVLDLGRVHDLAQAGEGVLVAAAAVLALRSVGQLQPGPDPATRLGATAVRVRELALGTRKQVTRGDIQAAEEYAAMGADGPDWDELVNVFEPGVLRPPFTAALDRSPLVEPLRELLAARPRPLVALIDGLDRLRDRAAFRRFTAQDLPLLRKLGVGVVLVGPPVLVLDRVEAHSPPFDRLHLLGAVPVEDAAGRSFLMKLVRARAADDLLPAAACDALVDASGGLLRDLISIARSAGEEAYADGAEAVGPAHVAAAAAGFGAELLRGISADMERRLKDFLPPASAPRARGLVLPSLSDVDLRLFLDRLILQVQAAPPRFVPHPTVVPLLRGPRG